MKELLGIYPLKNKQTNEFEDAELYKSMDEKNAKDFETLWHPALKERLNNLEDDENAGSVNAQDAHWKWNRKIYEREGRIDCESFAVECNDVTQGMLFVSSTYLAREESQSNKFLIYVELISSAPWNRPSFTENRLYKGIGPLLLATAISYSIEQEFDGRIGLHSLPQSESWYQGIPMTDLGKDSARQNLRYFEMTALQSQTYITT